jgi:succinoglycan biosynthesis protein ExoO
VTTAPRVSVLVAAHNAEDTVERAIRSVLEQTFRDFEVVVVDDGSTDATARVVADVRDDRVRLVRRDTNDGPGATRNRALEVARGTWLTILDADDAYVPARLERLWGLADQLGDPKHILVDPALRVVATPSGLVPVSGSFRTGGSGFRIMSGAEAIRAGLGGQPFFHRDLLERTGARYPVDVRSGEDTAFLIRLLADPDARFVRVFDSYYLYTQTQGTLTGSSDRNEHRRRALREVLAESLPDDLRSAVEGDLQRLDHADDWELLRAGLRDRKPARVVAILSRHPNLLLDVFEAYRRHRRYRQAMSAAQGAPQRRARMRGRHTNT